MFIIFIISLTGYTQVRHLIFEGKTKEADKKVLGFISEKFRNNPEIKNTIEEKLGSNLVQKESSISEKKKGRGIY